MKRTSYEQFYNFCMMRYVKDWFFATPGCAISHHRDNMDFTFFTKSGLERELRLYALPKKKNGMNFKKDLKGSGVKNWEFHLTYEPDYNRRPVVLDMQGITENGEIICYPSRRFATVEEAYAAAEYNK